MKKKAIVILLSILFLGLICIVTYLYLTRPTPIVKDIDGSHIANIQYNSDGRGVMTLVKDYNEADILNYLSTCHERRTFALANGYQLGDVTISIVLRTNRGLKEILLGNINYSYDGRGTPIFEIDNAHQVKANLLKMLNLKD